MRTTPKVKNSAFASDTFCLSLAVVIVDTRRQLLTRDPSKRLGSSLDDAQEVQRHPFFKSLEWDSIMRREVAPPWEPNVVGSLDTSQFDREFTSMPIFSPEQRDHKVMTRVTARRRMLHFPCVRYAPFVCRVDASAVGPLARTVTYTYTWKTATLFALLPFYVSQEDVMQSTGVVWKSIDAKMITYSCLTCQLNGPHGETGVKCQIE